jgi:hypothetical protein
MKYKKVADPMTHLLFFFFFLFFFCFPRALRVSFDWETDSFCSPFEFINNSSNATIYQGGSIADARAFTPEFFKFSKLGIRLQREEREYEHDAFKIGFLRAAEDFRRTLRLENLGILIEEPVAIFTSTGRSQMVGSVATGNMLGSSHVAMAGSFAERFNDQDHGGDHLNVAGSQLGGEIDRLSRLLVDPDSCEDDAKAILLVAVRFCSNSERLSKEVAFSDLGLKWRKPHQLTTAIPGLAELQVAMAQARSRSSSATASPTLGRHDSVTSTENAFGRARARTADAVMGSGGSSTGSGMQAMIRSKLASVPRFSKKLAFWKDGGSSTPPSTLFSGGSSAENLSVSGNSTSGPSSITNSPGSSTPQGLPRIIESTSMDDLAVHIHPLQDFRSYYFSRTTVQAPGLYLGLFIADVSGGGDSGGLSVYVHPLRKGTLPMVRLREDARLTEAEWEWILAGANEPVPSGMETLAERYAHALERLADMGPPPGPLRLYPHGPVRLATASTDPACAARVLLPPFPSAQQSLPLKFDQENWIRIVPGRTSWTHSSTHSCLDRLVFPSSAGTRLWWTTLLAISL